MVKYYPVIILIALALFVLVSMQMGCQPIEIGEPGAMTGNTAPVEKSGELTKDETWTGNIIVKDDILVPEDITLIITDGTTIKFEKDKKLLVDGNLYVEGQPNRAVIMTSAESEPEPGDWGGILISDLSLDTRIEYCVIDFHTLIVCQSDSLRLNRCIIGQASQVGLVFKACSPTIEDNKITKNGIGILCDDSASPNINYNVITANLRDGIECKRSSFAKISHNLISNNLGNGISCYSGSSPEINQNNIMYNSDWAVYGGGKLNRNFIQGNKERGMDVIDTGESMNGDQYYNVESVDSPRSSRIEEAGVRREERW
ncbi:hypothetical protein GF312_00880 [Candidatus Poribacteria bacterium]|nr:hypothetical protein [Candidatus Poribacteria bacterium]